MGRWIHRHRNYGQSDARCLLDAGHNVTVYDVRREATTTCANWALTGTTVRERWPRRRRWCSQSLPGPVEAERVVTDPDTGILAGLPVRGRVD